MTCGAVTVTSGLPVQRPLPWSPGEAGGMSVPEGQVLHPRHHQGMRGGPTLRLVCRARGLLQPTATVRRLDTSGRMSDGRSDGRATGGYSSLSHILSQNNMSNLVIPFSNGQCGGGANNRFYDAGMPGRGAVDRASGARSWRAGAGAQARPIGSSGVF